MAYASRTVKAVASSNPLIHVNQPHSDEHGSVAKEYKHRLSHADACYGNDNEFFYGYLEEATRGTIFAASIKSFERARNDRGAWMALNNQHAGESKWRAILKEAENYINGTKWDGITSVSLNNHINNLRRYYNDMENAADHIAYQLPNGRIKVQRFADSIEECKDTKIFAAIANTLDSRRNMCTDFEAAVGFVLPHDPVSTK